MVKQGDIILVNFNPAIGHEQQKLRPALVVSNNVFNNRCGGLVAVCPISHANNFPMHIQLEDGLTTNGKILCQHLRVMDIKSRGYQTVEHISEITLQKVLRVVKGIFEN